MKKIIVIIAIAVSLAACSSVMFTGRKQMKMIPASEMASMAVSSYRSFIDSSQLSANEEYNAMVQAAGANIKAAVETYMTQNGYDKQLALFEWEFNVIENDEINAWAMPGGKIVFYTGIMPICQDENGVAVVMGHEIAHVLAGHGNERMTQQLMAQFGSIALSEAIKQKPEQTQMIFNTSFAIGAQYGALLPYSRLHEKEADKIGQIIMAMAGYDPVHAISLWERMAALSGASPVPEVLSTHPSNSTRIAEMQENLEAARKYYK